MTNIKDIAQYCGVAVSTVSRVLNDHPDVSEETREKVLRAVEQLDERSTTLVIGALGDADEGEGDPAEEN